MRATFAERRLVLLVTAGLLEIRGGEVWRIRGHRQKPILPHRLERSAGKYLSVTAWESGSYCTCQAHRLVWQSLFGDIPDGFEVDHVNGRKTDNRPENLELVSHSENMRRAYRLGTHSQVGALNAASKLSEEQVVALRLEYSAGGVSGRLLAEKYQTSVSNVSLILRGVHWPLAGGPIVTQDQRHSVSPRCPLTGRYRR